MAKIPEILIAICTKDRDRVLGRCFAGLINQSHQGFDVLIMNDGGQKVGLTEDAENMLKILKRHHHVEIIPGTHVSQAHNWNLSLYNYPYKYIIRLDDDIVLDRDAVHYMYSTIVSTGAGAVGGLWFEKEWVSEKYHDRAMITWEPRSELETAGKIGDVNSNWQQRMYHHDLQSVEHLYSVCIYDAEAMRLAGGWPEVYSRGVAHGEETDGTYRLYLSGRTLLIDPRVTGQHLKSGGGIRSTKDVSTAQLVDNAKWQARRPEIEKIDFSPTVAIWCQHSSGFGGAQRLFYQTIHLLQSTSGLDVHPVFTGEFLSPKECEEAFGFDYDYREKLDEYDVCVVFGHEPFKPVKAKNYLLYTFFPDGTRYSFDGFRAILSVAKYSTRWVGEKWGYEAHHLYPPVKPIGEPVEKENIIMAVCRADPYKAPLWMAERFVEFGFEGWEFHLVLARTGLFVEYEKQIEDFFDLHDNLILHQEMSEDDLKSLYRRSKILWHAKGILAENNPQEAEHFGLVSIEAASAACVPVVYDLGGHRETVVDHLRWKTVQDLREVTERVMESSPKDLLKPINTDESWYAKQFERWIRRVNALSVELNKVSRIEVKSPKIRVAAIADSPRLTTGFAHVAKEVYKRILDQNDMELFVFGIMDADQPKKEENLPYEFYPAPLEDLQGRKSLPLFYNWAEPDVIWELYDPGNLWSHMMSLKMLGQGIPWVTYFPIEGAPVMKQALSVVEASKYPVTYCRSGAEEIERAMPGVSIDHLYHGIDHAPFAPLDPEKRTRLRKLIGWDDKFVIGAIGTNKRVKQHPYLIDAMRKILQDGFDEVYLYLHTKEFDDNIMQGWDLKWIIDSLADEYDISLDEHILFPPVQNKWRGTPFKYDEDLDIWRMTTPPGKEMRGAVFAALDFITRIGLFDLYVDVSSAEGFGLPPLEACACGVPTISVDDGMVRSEVHACYCDLLTPKHWTTWHTGARLALIDPEDLAENVEYLLHHPEELDAMSSRAVRVWDDLKWEPTAQKFVDLIRKAYAETHS